MARRWNWPNRLQAPRHWMGIELPYEGDRLGEYCQRFVDNGNYTQWIHDGWLKDWLILDCRTSSPQPYNVVNQNFGELCLQQIFLQLKSWIPLMRWLFCGLP
ncbi:hypothetical protein MAP00_000971 [Monascus purpureus]|nr:hypothetical protein MAP00_000971 [Monascus purpureus]